MTLTEPLRGVHVANSKRMGQLIDDLLQLSSITRRELVRAPCDLAVLARGIVEELNAGLLRAALENLIDFVEDHGAGFDRALAGKLFAPFQCLHSSEELEGAGIGLSRIQRMISRHGGKIWAESERGRGATLFFTLGWQ